MLQELEFGTGCASQTCMDGLSLPFDHSGVYEKFVVARESVIMPVVEMSFPEYKLLQNRLLCLVILG